MITLVGAKASVPFRFAVTMCFDLREVLLAGLQPAGLRPNHAFPTVCLDYPCDLLTTRGLLARQCLLQRELTRIALKHLFLCLVKYLLMPRSWLYGFLLMPHGWAARAEWCKWCGKQCTLTVLSTPLE